MSETLSVIAGLGNPEERYADTLHNAGFWCVDELARRAWWVAPVSDTKSTSVDFKIGFSILGGFLKALGVDPAPVSASVSGAKKMAFSPVPQPASSTEPET